MVGTQGVITSPLQDAEGENLRIELGVVSGDFFRVMGVPAALGVTLEPDDDRPVEGDGPAGPTPLVLDHDTRVTRFGTDSSIVGRSLPVGGDVMTVVGVMPHSFRLHLPAGSPGSRRRIAGAAIQASATPAGARRAGNGGSLNRIRISGRR